jgi:hypothetical protein
VRQKICVAVAPLSKIKEPIETEIGQRREEVLRAGRGGALCHVQITDCGCPLFQRWISGIEIFIDDHFPFDNEFRTGL